MLIRIRSEVPGDEAAIEAVTIAAFLNAPHSEQTEHFIIKALRDAGALDGSLVADVDGDIVGHAAISPVTISDGSTGWFGLGPIAVRPELQCRGIGSQLVTSLLRQLMQAGAAGCVVLGDPRYYARFGFRPTDDLIYPGVPPEYFQALSFDSPLPRGTVSYNPAFNAAG